ncbi:MAG: DUF6776 family protein [Gammaproteobacteria bacterium]
MSANDPHRHVVLRGVSPLRLRVFAALALVLIVLGGWGLFALGRAGIGAGDTGPASSPATLRQAIRERDELIESLRQSVAELDTLKAAQNPEREEVSRTIGELQAEVARQRQQLEFYKGVVASTEPAPNVAIRSLRVEPSATKGRAQLRLSLVQPGNPQSLVSGQVKVILEGARSGGPVRVQLFETPYNFRYFENIDRELSIPAGVSPERLQIEIEPSGRPSRPVVQSLLWPL